MSALSTTKMRLERLADERARVDEKRGDLIALAEEEERPLNEYEQDQVTKYRTQVEELEEEIEQLAADVERSEKSRDVSKLIRVNEPAPADGDENSPVVYRTFAAYARDQLITRYPMIASAAAGGLHDSNLVREQAKERLQRAVEHTTTSQIPGLLPPTHMAEIMDIINDARPVVVSARQVNLERGSLTYPKITQRPTVTAQGTVEKVQGGSANMQATLETMTAETYIGGGNLSWQAINWSTPDALQLWFNLAAESYARATETAACAILEAAAAGTVSPSLGTVGTEDFGKWRDAVIDGIGSVYSTTSGRARTNTLYLAANRFFQLAGIGTDQVLQISPVGNLDVGAMTGTFAGLRVVGSYGFQTNTAIVGDSSAFLVGETAGAPVELRAVEPAIGGMEVGVIGAFQAKVFDTDRFLFLS